MNNCTKCSDKFRVIVIGFGYTLKRCLDVKGYLRLIDTLESYIREGLCDDYYCRRRSDGTIVIYMDGAEEWLD